MGITTLRRRDYLRTVLTTARAAGDTDSLWQSLDDAGLHFDDEADLLVELHREWLRVLVGQLHRGVIVAQRSPGDVRDLYAATCRDHPTLRRILDTHQAHPALWEATAREHAMLARIAGLAPDGVEREDAAAQGHALVTGSAGRVVVPQRVPSTATR